MANRNYYNNAMKCMPALSGSSGALVALLDAILVNGIPPTLAVTSITRSGSTATLTTAAAHGLTTGQYIVVTGATQTEYNITAQITVSSSTVVTYTVSGTPATPATGTPVYANVCAITRSGTTATVTTNQAHGYVRGMTLTISGATEIDYNITFVVTSVPSTTTFTYTVAGSPTTPATGTPIITIPSLGWSTTFSSGSTKRVYRPAAGPRHYLRIVDDRAQTGLGRVAVVRAGEGATDVDTLVDPYPTAAQFADSACLWAKSSTDDATARTYDIAGDDSFLYYWPQPAQTGNIYTPPVLFGYFYPFRSTDTSYNSQIIVSCVASANSASYLSSNPTPYYWDGTQNGAGWYGFAARTPDGLVKSTRIKQLDGYNAALFPGSAGMDYPTNADTKLNFYRPFGIFDLYSTSTTANTFGYSMRGMTPLVFVPHIANSYTGIAIRDSIAVGSMGSDVSMVFLHKDITNGASAIMKHLIQVSGTWPTPS